MNRHPAWILAVVMAALVALFFGYEVPDRIRIDGLSTEGYGLMKLMNTQYADGYSHAGFRRIKVGMSEQEVLDILGAPLNRLGPYAHGFEGFREKGQYVSLIYSMPPDLRNTNYRARVVSMNNGVVFEVYGRFSAD